MNYKLILSSILILLQSGVYAQVEMADDFRGEGKIYVVLAIILTIMIGFFFLLFKLDNRTKRLEKEIEGEK